MSNENKIPNEDELWNVLNNPGQAAEEKAAPAEAAAPAPKAEKSGRKIDGFFLGCMAGVAAVSVAVTLAVSSMMGGGNASSGTPGISGGNTGSDTALQTLQEENEQLRTQVQLQQKTILDLQNSLMELMGTEEFLENMPDDPELSENDILQKQTEAYDLLVQIQEAYGAFDRDTLEELIPQMDTMLSYLSPDALNSYYLILEYMEQPSNG